MSSRQRTRNANTNNSTSLRQYTDKLLYLHTPHKTENFHPVGPLDDDTENGDSNTDLTTLRLPSRYLSPSLAYGRPRHPTGHGFSMGLKKCTAQIEAVKFDTSACSPSRATYRTSNCLTRNS